MSESMTRIDRIKALKLRLVRGRARQSHSTRLHNLTPRLSDDAPSEQPSHLPCDPPMAQQSDSNGGATETRSGGDARARLDAAILDFLDNREKEKNFEIIVRETRSVVKGRLCRFKKIREDEREELMQDVYQNVAAHCDQLRSVTDVFGWISRIAENVGIDHLRSKQAHKRAWEFDARDVSEIEAKSAASGREVAPSPERLAELKVALDSLSKEDRECLIYHEVHGLTLKEIGKRVKLKKSAVSDRVARTKARLREMVSRW